MLSPISGTITPQDVAAGGPLAGVYATSPNRLDGWTRGANLCNASQSGGAHGVAVDGGGTVCRSSARRTRTGRSWSWALPAG